MRTEHLEVLVEEPTAEAYLREVLPKVLCGRATFAVYPFRCKEQMLSKLEDRLRGYANWLPPTWRIVVLIDQDDDDCRELRLKLDAFGAEAGLCCPSSSVAWRLANRIVVQELEAWYFGDWEGVRAAFPRVPESVPSQKRYRDPEAIKGGTKEAFWRILRQAGYYKTGARRVEAARLIGPKTDPNRSRSRSFQGFRDLILRTL